MVAIIEIDWEAVLRRGVPRSISGNAVSSRVDEFEFTGFWWLPTNPENKVPGTLRYRVGDRMTLELFGSLQGDLDGSEDDSNNDIILGLAEGTRICTLQKLIRTSSRSIGQR